MIPGQPVTQARRQTQHPLPHGHPREHLVDQVRRALGHAPSAAARTEPAPMTRERHEAVEPTSLAPKPREAPAEPPAPKKVAELLLDETGQPLAGAEVGCLHTKRLEVIAHHLIQDAARGLPWLVCRRWRQHTRRSAEPMPLRATSETGECSSDEARSHAVSAYATEPRVAVCGIGPARASLRDAPARSLGGSPRLSCIFHRLDYSCM